ncbi:MAG: hypothetical protein EOM87_01410 [Clostridia bacterium]|nr:hypothetical protein [Clostridia bacterium]
MQIYCEHISQFLQLFRILYAHRVGKIILGILKDGKMNGTIKWKNIEDLANKNIASLVFNSELNFNLQVHTIADVIYNNKNIKLVLIAGPSASGKTTFANLLSERLVFLGANVHRISLDDFFFNRDDIEFLPSGVRDFDSPKALDMNALRNVLQGIINGDAVEIPQFDFATGTRGKASNILYTEQEDVVIIEGIHALNPLLFEGFNPKCQVHKIAIAPRRNFSMPDNRKIAPNDLRLLRRLIRDYFTRGHTLQATVAQWKEVLLAEKQYVLPYLEAADSLVDSVYEYELIIYKHCFYNKLASSEVKGLEELKAALATVADFEIPSIPFSSLINEFVFYD